jgi:phosphatidylserine decarboxylase
MIEILLIHLCVIAGIFAAIIFLFILYRFWFFFRSPEREIPDGDVIVAPADGRINYIRRIWSGEVPLSVKKGVRIALPELMDDPGGGYDLVIGIFMTPFSVHHNRVPFSGVVKKTAYRAAPSNRNMLRASLNLIFDLRPLAEGCRYILENERNTTVIEGACVRGAVVQIADKWVRKIDTRLKEGDRVTKGDIFGMIRMGSQCDLFLRIDRDFEVAVRENQFVKAGSSTLVRLV